MALKTDYKEDVFTGNRKYQMIDNGDDTVSFVDVTSYSQVGDTFGAADINATNTAINGISTEYSGTATSTTTRVQKIAVSGIYHDIDGTKYMETTGTLSTTQETTFSFTNADILSTSFISVAAGRSTGDVSGEQNHFNYSSIYTTAGSCDVTYPPFTSAVSLTVRIYIR